MVHGRSLRSSRASTRADPCLGIDRFLENFCKVAHSQRKQASENYEFDRNSDASQIACSSCHRVLGDPPVTAWYVLLFRDARTGILGHRVAAGHWAQLSHDFPNPWSSCYTHCCQPLPRLAEAKRKELDSISSGTAFSSWSRSWFSRLWRRKELPSEFSLACRPNSRSTFTFFSKA